MTEAVQAVTEFLLDEWWCNEVHIHIFVGNEASKKVALKCGFYPKLEAYKDTVYSYYGTVESEECYVKTAGDQEWERRGKDFFSFSTATVQEAA